MSNFESYFFGKFINYWEFLFPAWLVRDIVRELSYDINQLKLNTICPTAFHQVHKKVQPFSPFQCQEGIILLAGPAHHTHQVLLSNKIPELTHQNLQYQAPASRSSYKTFNQLIQRITEFIGNMPNHLAIPCWPGFDQDQTTKNFKVCICILKIFSD
ncbi:MAG: hypothetical protein R2874_13245 [Desulfobacterales bacterium]